MTSFRTSDQFKRGLIVREGIDVDYLTVGGQSVTHGGPTGPTGPTGSTGATGPTGPAVSTASPTFTGTTTTADLTATGVVSMTNASISLTTLPTSDPHVAGRLFLTGTALQVSAG